MRCGWDNDRGSVVAVLLLVRCWRCFVVVIYVDGGGGVVVVVAPANQIIFHTAPVVQLVTSKAIRRWGVNSTLGVVTQTRFFPKGRFRP